MDFSHWNMAADFSISEVACLACGIEPDPNIDNVKVRSIERLLHNAYLRSRDSCWFALRQNEQDRLEGREESIPRYCADWLEAWQALPSRDLRRTFAEALRFPEGATLIAAAEDPMRFGRDDLETFFAECEFEPDVLLYTTILKRRTDKGNGDDTDMGTPRGSSTALATRERNTLLTMIAVLCKEAKLDYTRPAKTAGLILAGAQKMGLSLGETTIEGHLKKIPDALETRMK